MKPVLHARAFTDNYIWLIPGTANQVAVVDPGDAKPVLHALHAHSLMPVAILCTHHHWDHSGGINEIRAQYPIPVYGPAGEKIAGVTHPVREGDRVHLTELEQEYSVLDIPGHTAGHIAFYGHDRLFCGDTLFSAGCGRLFEGTPAQMHASLSKLAALPEKTEVYCGHEYTLANLQFALAVEPENRDLQHYQRAAGQLRAQDRPTLPSTIGLERRVNPFLRTAEPEVRRAVERQTGQKSDTDAAVFAILRRWKDDFKG